MEGESKKEGIVIKSTGKRYTVIGTDQKQYTCHIKGRFRMEGFKTTNPIAVGDHVIFDAGKDQDSYVVTAIKERKNYIIRKASNLSKLYHIVAANIDLAILVITVKHPVTTTEFIDRFLITSEAYSIPVLLLFNKEDIYDEGDMKELNWLTEIYMSIGYDCLKVSAISQHNLDVLIKKMSNKVSLISGNSGVGKSTLINCLNPSLNLKVNSISEYHLSGKHTTTFAEMFPLPGGGYIIDTPGIKGFGVIDFTKDELYHYFPEIFKISGNCKFHNCLHINEPQCAVKEAVQEGNISESRYFNYLSILLDEDSKYR